MEKYEFEVEVEFDINVVRVNLYNNKKTIATEVVLKHNASSHVQRQLVRQIDEMIAREFFRGNIKPTHSERMSLWWNTSEGIWKQVDTYNGSANTLNYESLYIFNGPVDLGRRLGEGDSLSDRHAVEADWFIGKEGKEIPPEPDIDYEVMEDIEGIGNIED